MTVQLGTAYTGNIVRDTTGQVFFLHRPSGMFNISGLPHGWKIRSEESLQSSPTGRWRQVFSPVASPGPNDPHVEFVQAFGAPADTTGADLQAPQRVNGAPTTYYLHKPTGEMVLVWQIGHDGVALVGNQAQFSLPQLISLAESIGPAE